MILSLTGILSLTVSFHNMRKKYYQIQYNGGYRNFHSFRRVKHYIKIMPPQLINDVKVLSFKNGIARLAMFVQLKNGNLTIRF